MTKPKGSRKPSYKQLLAVYDAARGLCHGADWNNGTQARLHGHRDALIRAVDEIDQLPRPLNTVGDPDDHKRRFIQL